MINYIYCTLHCQLLKFPRLWLRQCTLQCTFYDIKDVYYVSASLLIVNNLLYYVFNGHIFRSAINREGTCTMELLVLSIDAS